MIDYFNDGSGLGEFMPMYFLGGILIGAFLTVVVVNFLIGR